MMATANPLTRRFAELADLGARAGTSYQLWGEFCSGAMELIGRVFGKESPWRPLPGTSQATARIEVSGIA
jgi:hypothetical protein